MTERLEPLSTRMEEELRRRSEQLHALLEEAPLAVVLLDADFRIAQVNPAARPSFGDLGDLIGRDYGEVLHALWPDEVAAELVRIHRRTLETGEPFHEPELAEIRKDLGETGYLDFRVIRIPLHDGRHGVVCYFSDISAQVAARNAIAESEERYRTLFTSIDEGFTILEVIFDERQNPIDFRLLEVNPAFEHQTGLENAAGRTMKSLVPEMEAHWPETYAEVARTRTPKRFTLHASAQGRWFEVYAFPIGESDAHKVAALFTDVSDRVRAEVALRESESRLHHRAHHDPLTGLPNRLLFEDRLHLAVAAAARHERVLAVLFLDLDGFKLVNDGLGHLVGDAVLVEIAGRLQACLREGDTLARLHGDEFAVLLSEVTDPRDAGALARTLLAEVALPIEVAGTSLGVSASIGVSVYPRDARDPLGLLRAADIAMYRAKVGGKSDVRYFAPAMRAPALERVALAEHLDGALARGEIDLHFQPEWDGRTGSHTAFEALLRWSNPTMGEVPPERFVRVAEERGAFGPIVTWSLDACAGAARALSDRLGLPLRIALNVTPVRLVRADFVPQVEAVILSHGIAPAQLEIELTLGAPMGDLDTLRAALVRLHDLGVRVVLDRFGAEAGMIAALLDLCVAGVKLDADLVRRAERDPRFRPGLETIVKLVHDLALDVVGVGIENEAQRDIMLELGCERLQGFLIGRPLPLADAAELVARQRATPLF